VERLIASVDKYLLAKLLPGAGGGGFLFMVARDEQSARKVRQLLTRSPPNAQARFFDFAIDSAGLRVTVL